MKITKSYRHAVKVAKKMHSEIDCYDFMVNQKPRIISILHFDGSLLTFTSACFRNIENDYIVIYTEHHGQFVYHKEDIAWVKELINEDKYLFSCFSCDEKTV